MAHKTRNISGECSRRNFLKIGALGGAALATVPHLASSEIPAFQDGSPPNILFILTDQQGLDTISEMGCPYINTPNMDKLARDGTAFMESHSTNPLCSPARSSMLTGRMPSETTVIRNGLPIREDIPNLGQWFGQHGYETVYAGKVHLPKSFPTSVPGFELLPTGIGGHGNIGDAAISRACEGYLRNRTGSDPFLLVASFLQPHDICQYQRMHRVNHEVPYPDIISELPPLPPNFNYDPLEPELVANIDRPAWTDLQWRYYLWSYYRHVEMVDAEIGRVLQALEDAGYTDNTLIIFTSDHGEGRARHQLVVKNYLYEEALKVPFLISWPGHIPEGKIDRTHLITGLDVIWTMCDYAGIASPGIGWGRSLKPLLDGYDVDWRPFLVSEVREIGRMVRTQNFKLITYEGDPVMQLFDMQNDPGETVNLADDSEYDEMVSLHLYLLDTWEDGHEKPAKTAASQWQRYR